MNLSTAQHTVTAFDAEIHDLRAMVLEMGEKSTRAITRAIQALERQDLALAKSVVADDREIDELERRIDSLSIQTIALRAPMADDLRQLIATFKISSLAERIGDHATNIAELSYFAETGRQMPDRTKGDDLTGPQWAANQA